MITMIHSDGKIEKMEDRKFTTHELKNVIFKGTWHYLSYHHTEMDGKEKVTMYLITMDLSQKKRDEYPPYNPLASKIYNQDIYGTCILAPENCIR